MTELFQTFACLQLDL